MDNEFNAVAPDNGIIGIFQIVHKEEQGKPGCLWTVGVHTLFIRLGHGSLLSGYSIDHFPHTVPRLPAKKHHNETTQRVDSNMARQNVAVGFILQQGMEILN